MSNPSISHLKSNLMPAEEAAKHHTRLKKEADLAFEQRELKHVVSLIETAILAGRRSVLIAVSENVAAYLATLGYEYQPSQPTGGGSNISW